MGAINVLSKQVSELIAAGEVIERPSSVIKELVENSIDAHATSITVEIQHGGVTFMRVADNGSGILHDDVKNAFLRHATSKISEQNDLDQIATLGFRGEALASICAVSKVQLITRHADEADGTLYELEGGEEVTFQPTGCPQGTTFVIRDLFYNVPARMKFLKKDVAESNAIASLIDRIALSHPEIKFTFIRDGKQVMKTAGDGKLNNAIYQVFGKQFYSTLVPVQYEFDGVKLSGYVSKPSSSNRASRTMQMFFVNGRYVRTQTAMVALEQAYRGSIMTGKFPSCVIHLEVNCSSLDVNVHPAKLEIRFTNERPIYDCVYYATKSAIAEYDPRNTTTPKLDFVPTNPKVIAPTADKGTQLGFSYSSGVTSSATAKPSLSKENEPTVYAPTPSAFEKSTVADSSNLAEIYRSPSVNIRKINLAEYRKEKENASSVSHSDKPVVPFVPPITESKEMKSAPILPIEQTKKEVTTPSPVEVLPEPIQPTAEETVTEQPTESTEIISQTEEVLIADEQREVPFRYIGEAFNTYIILEYSDDRLMFIDKHAAHERLIYERLKQQHKDSAPQMLLEPITLTMDKNECQVILDNREMLSEAGFDVDSFGAGTIIIRSVPILLENMEITEQFMEIADYLVKHKKVILSEKMEWVYQNTACRAAIKGGNINHREELIDLALTLEKNPEIRYCPHGRPIYFFMSKTDLEKNFKRIV